MKRSSVSFSGVLRRLSPVFFLLFLCPISGQTPAAGGAARPNMVLIVADDMGWSDAGCYGSEIRTPSLDRLAAQGLQATRCYTVPRCSPSRACLLTGRYPQSVGVGHLDRDLKRPGYTGHLDVKIPTLAEILKGQGYRTYMAGKWHLGTGEGFYPWQRGFDHYRGLLGGANGYFGLDKGRLMAEDGRMLSSNELPRDFYMTEDITRTAEAYLKEAAAHRGSPFFLYVAYTAPHTPLEARRETIERYVKEYDSGFAAVQEKRLGKQKRLGLVPPDAKIPGDRRLPSSASEEERLRMAIYAAQVDDMDQGIGRLLKALDSYGLAGNTIVLFVSDNGATRENPARNYSPFPGYSFTRSGYGRNWASVSNTPYKGYKIETREGGVAVPFLLRFPRKVASGSRWHAPVHFMDVAPTLLSWAGIGKAEGMEGAALDCAFEAAGETTKAAGVWSSAGADKSRLVFCEHEGNRMVLSPRYKMVFSRGGKGWELYALEDRMEERNLASQFPGVVEELERAYQSWADSHQVDENIGNYYP